MQLSQRKNILVENGGNKSSHENEIKLVYNYPLTFLL